ncbi:hypothetical protein GWI33_013456, partial [Rhynchophorus ferrugineus]
SEETRGDSDQLRPPPPTRPSEHKQPMPILFARRLLSDLYIFLSLSRSLDNPSFARLFSSSEINQTNGQDPSRDPTVNKPFVPNVANFIKDINGPGELIDNMIKNL